MATENPLFNEEETQQLLQHEQSGSLDTEAIQTLQSLRNEGKFPLALAAQQHHAQGTTILGPPPPPTKTRFPWEAMGSHFSPPLLPENATPEQARSATQAYDKGARYGAATALEYGVPLATSLYPPAKAPELALKIAPMLLKAYQQVGYPLGKAALTALSQYFSSRGAQAIAPERETNPATMATATGIGEYLGGVGGKIGGAVGGMVGRSFGASPRGRMMQETLESRGGRVRPDMMSKNPAFQGTGVLFEHLPGGGPLRQVRQEGQDILNKALRDIESSFTKTGESVERMERMSGPMLSRATSPLRSAAEHANDLVSSLSLGSPDTLKQVPRAVQEKVRSVAHERSAAVHQAFQDLDTQVAQLPLDSSLMKSSVTQRRIPKSVEPGSIYHEINDVYTMIKNLPKNVTYDTVLEAREIVVRTVNNLYEHMQGLAAEGKSPLLKTLQDDWIPELNRAYQAIEQTIGERRVDMSGPKSQARKVLGLYSAGLPIPETVLEGGTGKAAMPMEDPHIMAAKLILDKPDYLSFFEAQQVRSDVAKIRREHQTPLIGNAPREGAEAMWNSTDLAMENAARKMDRVGPADPFRGKGSAGRVADPLGPIGTRWRGANTAYAKEAELLNSDLITQLHGASLDDILGSIIRNERPNDLKALRAVLGDALMDDVGNMWLQRITNQAKERTTRTIQPGQALGHIQDLTDIAKAELFPGGRRITHVENFLKQADALQRIPQTTDPIVMRDLMRQLPANRQHAAQSAWIERGIKRDPVTKQIDYAALQNHLENGLPPATMDALFPQSKGDVVYLQTHLARASALEEGAKEALKAKPDPIVLGRYRSIVGNDDLWRSVGGDWLSTHITINEQTKQINGRQLNKALVNLRDPSVNLQLFPDRGLYTELVNLSETLMVLEGSDNKIPYWLRHTPPAVQVLEGGTLTFIGLHLGATPMQMVTIAAGVPAIAQLLASKKFVKAYTEGLKTPWSSERAGQLLGIMLGEKLGAEMSENQP